MKPELDLLIEAYETEKIILTRSIQLFLADREYQMAHFQQKALHKLNDRLSVLKNLNDASYPEKAQLERYLENLKYSVEVADNSYPGWKNEIVELQNRIMTLEQELDQWRSIPRKKAPEGQEFDDALFDVVEGKSKGFRLFLESTRNMYLQFTINVSDKNLLEIKLCAQAGFSNFSYKISRVTELGFTLNAITNQYEKFADVTNFRNAHEIKILCSQLIFDYLIDYDRISIIEIME